MVKALCSKPCVCVASHVFYLFCGYVSCVRARWDCSRFFITAFMGGTVLE